MLCGLSVVSCCRSTVVVQRFHKCFEVCVAAVLRSADVGIDGVGNRSADAFAVQFEGSGNCIVKFSRLDAVEDDGILAAAQIADGEKNVTQLAQSCGYEDPLYFSRVFAKKYGLSPKKYILRLGSGEQAE